MYGEDTTARETRDEEERGRRCIAEFSAIEK